MTGKPKRAHGQLTRKHNPRTFTPRLQRYVARPPFVSLA